MLFALLREAQALRGMRDAFPIFAARTLVRARRLDLVLDLPDRIELRAIRARGVARRDALEELRATFPEVRAFVAARLRPLE